MIFLFLLPGYILVNFFMIVWLLRWFNNIWRKLSGRVFSVAVGIAYLFLALSPILAFILPRCGFAIAIRRLSTYWMGIILYFLMAILGLTILKYIIWNTRLRKTRLFSRLGIVSAGAFVFTVAGAVCIYGAVHARQIKTTEYAVTVNKQVEGMDDLNVVLIADTHMGYAIGRDHIKQMVDKINACEPDIVIFAGDIFDNSVEGLDYPDEIISLYRSIKAKYGVWATYGNHDIEEQILMGFTFNWNASPENDAKMREFVEKAGINLLCDESTLIDGKFYLVGRRDAAKPGTKDGSRLTPAELTEGLDKSKPILFIAHEPDELQETADAGADIDFSGHTHDGQVFPLTIITRSIWENCCGVLKKDNMWSVVTSGVGVFGPFMRIGTDAEICNVMIHFG